MKLVGQGERVNGEASRRGEKTKKKRKRESGLVVDKVRRTANDSNSPIYHSPLSPGRRGGERKGISNFLTARRNMFERVLIMNWNCFFEQFVFSTL